MGRISRTGIKGLRFEEDGTAKIDLRYRTPDGRRERYQETLPAITRAAQRLRGKAVLDAALAGTLQRQASTHPTTLAAAFDQYLELCPPTADPKYKRRHADQWIATLGASTPLERLSDLSVERHKKRRREQGKEPGTINRELTTFKHFARKAVAWGWMAKAPAVAMLPEPPGRVRWLTDDERARLAAALATPRRACFRRVVVAALLCGQRLGKIIGLRWADVDFEAATLTIRNMRKGGTVKTIHVPISAELEAVLREALAHGEECRRAKGKRAAKAGRNAGAVFLSTRGTPYQRTSIAHFVQTITAEAGVEDFHFHDTRHDFATRVRRGGADLDVVQALLGHATLAMTQRYAHLGRGDLATAATAAAGLPAARGETMPAATRKKGSR